MISKELEQKLEQAYQVLVDGGERIVIGQLTDDAEEINVYLLAKQPNIDIYYGVVESPFFSNELVEIPLSNFSHLVSKEVKIVPFPAQQLLDKNSTTKSSKPQEKVVHVFKFQLTNLNSFRTV